MGRNYQLIKIITNTSNVKKRFHVIAFIRTKIWVSLHTTRIKSKVDGQNGPKWTVSRVWTILSQSGWSLNWKWTVLLQEAVSFPAFSGMFIERSLASEFICTMFCMLLKMHIVTSSVLLWVFKPAHVMWHVPHLRHSLRHTSTTQPTA